MSMDQPILLCTDLDRTLLPNGGAPESELARPLFSRLVEFPDVTLAYVSGRSESLIRKAVHHFGVPVPDYAVGDVGSSIYRIEDGRFERIRDWDDEIEKDWGGLGAGKLGELFDEIDELTVQEPGQQGRFKLSYYTDPLVDRDALLERMRSILAPRGVRASLIWSVDEQRNTGLLDVLPERATKLHAIRFLANRLGFREDRVVFAGDSGNDLPALTSELSAALVANARQEVRDEAVALSRRNGTSERLYLARGRFLGMNGNYAAGVLEGVAHFIDGARQRLAALGRSIESGQR